MSKRFHIIGLCCAALIVFVFFVSWEVVPLFDQSSYSNQYKVLGATTATTATSTASMESVASTTPALSALPQSDASHVSAPAAIKALYMTSWVAGSPAARNRLIALATSTDINAVVIDIKDYTGYLSFKPNDPTLAAMDTWQNRIPDIDALIAELHANHIYIIGRIVTFQDPLVAQKDPQWAVQQGPTYQVKNATTGKLGPILQTPVADIGTPWKDASGLMWVDPGASGNWNYLAEIGKEAYNRGFDEVNFDYVRFPSDGDVADAVFAASGNTSPPLVLEGFFQYISGQLRGYGGSGDATGANTSGLNISADLFGMTTTATDDMGIGQVLDDALPYFNYVDPMVYPSHFSAGWGGFTLPDTHPYQVITLAMDSAVTRAKDLAAGTIATTTVDGIPRTKSVIASIEAIPLALREQVSPQELRPWLQDFELHYVPYTAPMIQQEFQATYDAGLSSWLLWDPSNKYTDAIPDLK